MKKTAFCVSMALVLLGFAALLLAPAAASAGARRGLEICGGTILPALLPFLILSALTNALGLPRLLARRLGTVTERLFGLPGAAAAPLLLGLTGGYPIGAACTAELTLRGELSRADAERTLAFCNNTGPAFIVGAAGAGVFGSTRAGLLLYLCHILAALCVGLLFSIGHRRNGSPSDSQREAFPVSLAAALPESVKRSVTGALNICGFVVLFSTVTALLDAFGIFSGAAGFLAEHTGGELSFVRALLTGLLELGGGVAVMRGLPPTPLNLALAAFLLGFGGLSVHCQTLAAVSEAGLSTVQHFVGRLLHGLLSALLAWVMVSLLFL